MRLAGSAQPTRVEWIRYSPLISQPDCAKRSRRRRIPARGRQLAQEGSVQVGESGLVMIIHLAGSPDGDYAPATPFAK